MEKILKYFCMRLIIHHPCDRFTLMFNLLNEFALPQNSNLKVVGILSTAALISYFQSL